MRILEFLGDRRHSGLCDFWHLESHDLPDSAGVYLLLAQRSIGFQYPLGYSPIFYIGQSKKLRNRLLMHLKFSKEAKEHRKLDLYWPRYEYAAHFGGRYCFILTRGNPKKLEETILAKFAQKYRSFPITNGTGSWRHGGP